MNSHYIVLADLGRLRIFTERPEPGRPSPGFEEVYAMDLAQNRTGYTENDTDVAGRFQHSKQQASVAGAPVARAGMSIDERLPMQREAHRRAVAEIAQAAQAFLEQRPHATWDFAAGPTTLNAVVERLSPAVRGRLRETYNKDLVNQPFSELRERFQHAV